MGDKPGIIGRISEWWNRRGRITKISIFLLWSIFIFMVGSFEGSEVMTSYEKGLVQFDIINFTIEEANGAYFITGEVQNRYDQPLDFGVVYIKLIDDYGNVVKVDGIDIDRLEPGEKRKFRGRLNVTEDVSIIGFRTEGRLISPIGIPSGG